MTLRECYPIISKTNIRFGLVSEECVKVCRERCVRSAATREDV